MAAVPAVLVVRPERIGHQLWEERITKRATLGRVLSLRLALVAATIAFGLVAGVIISRLLG
jgi:hypothetical protein